MVLKDNNRSLPLKVSLESHSYYLEIEAEQFSELVHKSKSGFEECLNLILNNFFK